MPPIVKTENGAATNGTCDLKKPKEVGYGSNVGVDVSCLARRAQHLITQDDIAFQTFSKMRSNEFSKDNRGGNINFCTAEDTSCIDLMRDFLNSNSNKIFHTNPDHICFYAPPGGLYRTKTACAKYLKGMHGCDLDPNNISILPSGNSVYDQLTGVLCDEGDVLLCSLPAYCRNYNSIGDRGLCRMEGVQVNLTNPTLNIEDYERKLQDCKKQGDRVRALIIINPNNPLGYIFSKKEVIELCNWATKNGLWVLFDEAFALNDHNEKYETFLNYQHTLADPSKIIYFRSIGKDYGLPGVKLCMVHVPNPTINKVFARLELIHPVSALAQEFFVNFTAELDFLKKFTSTKNMRLRAHKKFILENLTAMGIPYVQADAGIFLFINLGVKMREVSIAAEQELVMKLGDVAGVFMQSGSYMGNSEPGWFRLAYGCQAENIVEGIKRMHDFFGVSKLVGSIQYDQ